MGGRLKIIISLRGKLLHQKSRKGNQRNILYSILNTCGFTFSLHSWRLKLFQTHISCQTGLQGHSSGAQGGSVQKEGQQTLNEIFFSRRLLQNDFVPFMSSHMAFMAGKEPNPATPQESSEMLVEPIWKEGN